MPSSYTTHQLLEKPAPGEQNNTWGTTLNTNFDFIDAALSGGESIALTGDYTLETLAGTASPGRNRFLIFTGSLASPATITVAPSTAKKVFFVRNDTNQSLVFTQGSGSSAAIPAGRSMIVYCDGGGSSAAVINVAPSLVQSAAYLTPLGSAPTPAVAGAVYYDNPSGSLRFHNGSGWQQVLLSTLTQSLNANGNSITGLDTVSFSKASAWSPVSSTLTSAAADEKKWDIAHGVNSLSFRLTNDAGTQANPFLLVGRSGYAPSYIAIGVNPQVADSTLGIHNNAAGGSTLLTVRAGASQGTSPLLAVKNSAGSALLDFVQYASTGSLLTLRDTSAASALHLSVSSSLGRVGTDSAHDLELRTNSVQRVLVKATGNVEVKSFLVLTSQGLPGTPAAGMLAIDSGDSNKLKWYDGIQWQVAGGGTSGGGTPGGSDTNIQFNNAGSFGGSANLTWNNSTSLLYVNGTALFGTSSNPNSSRVVVYGQIELSQSAVGIRFADGTTQTTAFAPAGSATQIQFNSSGVFAGSSKLTWNDSTSVLYVNGSALFGTASNPNSSRLVVYGQLEFSQAGAGIRFADGTTQTTAATTTVPGSNTQVVFNNSGALGASSDFTFNDGTNVLYLNGSALFGTASNPNSSRVVVYGQLDLAQSGYGIRFPDGTAQVTAASVPGSNGQIGFNNSGAWGASANLTWDNSASRLSVGGFFYHKGEVHIAVRTGSYTAVAGDVIPTQTSGGSFTVTLPASPSAGHKVRIYDYSGTWHTNPLTVARNGANIMGLAENLVCDIRWASIDLVYVDATKGWVLV